MRTSEIDILIIPGWSNAGPDHWQSRWQRNLKTARRVEQADWETPQCADWVQGIVAAVGQATRPVVLVAHGCGTVAVAHAARHLDTSKVAGAFLTAVPDFTSGHDIWPARHGGFMPVPAGPLPFPAKLIGSSTDPYCPLERTQDIGRTWAADVSIIAGAGHLNTASGHGPWPEGLLTFGLFLKKLG